MRDTRSSHVGGIDGDGVRVINGYAANTLLYEYSSPEMAIR